MKKTECKDIEKLHLKDYSSYNSSIYSRMPFSFSWCRVTLILWKLIPLKRDNGRSRNSLDNCSYFISIMLLILIFRVKFHACRFKFLE